MLGNEIAQSQIIGIDVLVEVVEPLFTFVVGRLQGDDSKGFTSHTSLMLTALSMRRLMESSLQMMFEITRPAILNDLDGGITGHAVAQC